MQRREVDLAALVAGLVNEVLEAAAEQSTQLVAKPAAAAIAAAVDPVQLRVAIKALVTNSLEALGEGGRIEIGLRCAPKCDQASEREAIEIVVTDTGPGIPADVRPHIFDPFYSGREAGRGLGMGLPKCWRIIREHGGRIDVESDPPGGATFRITLPTNSG
jgi:hypothetical protein